MNLNYSSSRQHILMIAAPLSTGYLTTPPEHYRTLPRVSRLQKWNTFRNITSNE